MKKIISILISMTLILTNVLTIEVRAEGEDPLRLNNEAIEMKTSEYSEDWGFEVYADLNFKLVFDEYSLASENPISLEEISQELNVETTVVDSNAYADFEFKEITQPEEGSPFVEFCPKYLEDSTCLYRMTVKDSGNNDHIYFFVVTKIEDIDASEVKTVYVETGITYRIIIDNDLDADSIKNIFKDENGNSDERIVVEGFYNDKMIYFYAESNAEDCTFKYGNTEIAIKPYSMNSYFSEGQEENCTVSIEYGVRYKINFDFDADTQNASGIYIKDYQGTGILFEEWTEEYVYMTVQDTDLVDLDIVLCVKEKDSETVQETNMHVEALPEAYDATAGITISQGSYKKIDLGENQCWSKYQNPVIHPAGDSEVNLYSDDWNDDHMSVGVSNTYFTLYCGNNIEEGDYVLEFTYGDDETKSFIIHVTGSESDIPRNHNLETATKVSTLADLNTAINTFKYQKGGVIQITGMDSITGNIEIKHVEPITDYTDGLADINLPGFADYLLIDLTCDLDLGEYQLILPAMEETEKNHSGTSDSGVIIRGNGHKITSSNENATLVINGQSRLLLLNITIENTHLESGEATNNAYAVSDTNGNIIADSKTNFVGPNGVALSGNAALSGNSNLKGTVGPALVIEKQTYTASSIKNATTEAEDNIAIVNNCIFDGESSTLTISGEVNGTIVWNNGKLEMESSSSINSASDCIRINSDEIKSTDNAGKDPTIYLIFDADSNSKAKLTSVGGSCIKEVSTEKTALKQLKIADGEFTCSDSASVIDLGSLVDRNANNIDIAGGTYSKKVSDTYLNTNKYSWSGAAPYTLTKNQASVEANVSSYNELINAINAETETINVTANITKTGSEEEVIDIPYPVKIDLKGHTLTGYCLKFSKEYGEGVTADYSEIANGKLVAVSTYAIDNLTWLSASGLNVEADDSYKGYVIRSTGSGITEMESCNVTGYKGIDYARTASFLVNMIPFQLCITTIETESTAISDENAASNTLGICVGDYSTVKSTGGTAVEIVKGSGIITTFNSTVEGMNGIKANGNVSLGQGSKVQSIKYDENNYSDANAAIIIDGAVTLTSYGSTINSDSKYAIILNVENVNVSINGGYYSSTEEVIHGEQSAYISVSRGHFSNEIDENYLPEGWSCVSVDNSEMPYVIVMDLGTETIGGYTLSSYLNADDEVSVNVDANLIKDVIADENVDQNIDIIFNASEESESEVDELEDEIGKDIIDCYDLSIIKKTTENNNDVFDELHEVAERQIITIDLSDEAKASDEPLHIYHNNSIMAEVSSNEALQNNEEDCVFIDKDAGKVYIKTSTFSPFSVVNGTVNHEYTAPTAKTSLTYTGSAMALVDAGTVTDASGCSMEYSIDNENWSESVPTVTDAGTYSVYYRIAAKDIYKELEATEISGIVIAKMTPSINTTPSAVADLTYNGTELTLISAGGSNAGTVKYAVVNKNANAPAEDKYSSDLPKVTNAGIYTVYYKIVGDKNINSTEPTTFDVTIAKANPSAEVPTGIKATYGDTLADVELTSGWAFTSEETTSVGNAGNHDFAVKYTPTDTANYLTKDGTVTIEVEKAASAVTAPVAKTDLVYSASAQDLVSAGSTTDGTIKYAVVDKDASAPADGDYQASVPQKTDAGSYDVYYKVFGDSNHKDTDAAKITVTIAKANPVKPVLSSVLKSEHKLLSDIVLPTGWSWVDGTKEVSSLNKAKFHLDDNYNDVETDIAIGIEDTVEVGAKQIQLTTSFETKGNLGNANNSGAINSVMDALTNPESKTKFTGTMGTILSEAASNGDSIEVNTYLEINDEYIPTQEEKNKIQNILPSNGGITKYMSIDLVIKVKVNGGTEQTDKIHELSDSIETVIKLDESEIPAYDSSKQELTYQLVEIHDGVAKVINCRFDATNKTVTADLEGFSTYAIMYKLVNKTVSSDDTSTSYKVVNTSTK